MPEPGWKSLTVPEELYEKIKKLAEKRGVSPPKLLRELVEEGEKGLGNPARPSPADLGRARRKGKAAVKEVKA